MESAPQVWYDSQGRLRSGARPQGVASHPLPPQYKPASPAVLHPVEQYPTASLPQSGYSYNPATVQVQVFSQSGGSAPYSGGLPHGHSGSLPPVAPQPMWEQQPASSAAMAYQPSAASPPVTREGAPPADATHQTGSHRPRDGHPRQQADRLTVNATDAHSMRPPDRVAGEYGQYNQQASFGQHGAAPFDGSPAQGSPAHGPEDWHGDSGGYAGSSSWQHEDSAAYQAGTEAAPGQPWDEESVRYTEGLAGYDDNIHTGYGSVPQHGEFGSSPNDHAAWYSETASPRELKQSYESHSAETELQAETDGTRADPYASDSESDLEAAPEGASEDGDRGAASAAPLWFSFSRGVALFLGMLALMNVLGEMRVPEFDGSLWWIDLRRLPASVARGLLATFAGLSLSFGLAGRLPGPVRKLALSLTGVLLLFSVWSMLDFYQSLRNGMISTAFPVPFSLHVAACFAVLLRGLMVPASSSGRSGSFLLTMATVGLCLLAFPLCQICCSGHADCRRPADAVVVFGCGVDQQGNPSHALQDRMRTCCELYHAGLAGTVVLSGGPGPGMVHETEAMRKLAEQAGIPESAIRIDRDGFDTLSTVRNLSRMQMVNSGEPFSALMVSHFYHLPRIGLCCRQSGISASPVPARQKYVLRWQAWYIAREIPALWRCWLRPVLGQPAAPASSLASADIM